MCRKRSIRRHVVFLPDTGNRRRKEESFPAEKNVCLKKVVSDLLHFFRQLHFITIYALSASNHIINEYFCRQFICIEKKQEKAPAQNDTLQHANAYLCT
jgi:hypothetical protein